MASKYTFELFPGRTLTAVFVTNVSSSDALLEHFKNQTLPLPIAFLNPEYFVSEDCLSVAANKALASHTLGHVKTNSLQSELVYAYSAHHNINHSLQKFGISSGQKNTILLIFDASDEQIQAATDLVGGQVEPLQTALTFQNKAAIKKHYKLSDAEIALSGLSDAVITRISTHGI